MISSVIIADDFIEVYDEHNQNTSSLKAANKEIAAGSESFYVVYSGNLIEVYNAESKLISTMIRGNKVVIGTVANTITIKNDLFIESYDENCNFKHVNNSVSAINKIMKRELELIKNSLIVEQDRFQKLKNITGQHGQYETFIPIRNIGTKLNDIIQMIENSIK